MKFVVLFVLFASLLVASVYSDCSGEPSCDNPLGKYNRRWWVRLHYLDNATTVDNANAICGQYFSNGAKQCCDAAVYDLISDVFQDAAQELRLTVAAMRNYANTLKTVRANYEKIADNSDADERLKELVRDILDAFDKFLQNIIINWASCASGILKYNLGLICLGCDANWRCYIEYDILRGPVLRLTEATCESMRGQCGTFFNDFSILIQDIATAVANYAGVIPPLINNPCGGDCGQYICDILVNAQSSDLTVGGTITNTGTTSRTLAPDSSFVAQLGHLPINKELLQGLDDIHSGVTSLFSDKQNKASAQLRQTGGGIQASAYYDVGTDNTFDAYKVGADSSLDTTISSASILSSWLNLLY